MTMLRQPISRCPDCDERLTEGFLLDGAQNANRTTDWIEGPADVSKLWGVKIKGRARWRCAASRCPACGRVVIHAREQITRAR